MPDMTKEFHGETPRIVSPVLTLDEFFYMHHLLGEHEAIRKGDLYQGLVLSAYLKASPVDDPDAFDTLIEKFNAYALEASKGTKYARDRED